MKLRITGRHDSLLLAGFTFSLLVIFQRSLLYLFSVANDIEHTYGVALVPALLILSVMFAFHLYANRREAHAEAAAAAKEAALARARTQELEQLMAFGQALSRALTLDSIHEAIWRHLPPLADGAETWMLIRRTDDWERVTDRAQTHWRPGELEGIADAVLHAHSDGLVQPDGIDAHAYVCFPVTAGGRLAGMIGLSRANLPPEVRRTVGTAATLLGISLRNVQLFAEVRDHGLRDALTGCFNRAHGLEVLESELARARRSNAAVSVLMFDVDQFKSINDTHGHLCGDAVLGAVGQRLRQVLRRSDVRCRYGGDEFLVVLPETPAAGATRVAEWVRGEIEQIDLARRFDGVKATVSIGVATWTLGESLDALLDRADRALYAAKGAGRNCVRAAAPGRRLEIVPAAPRLMAASAALD
jgi:diguanylate cyclase (GGDEF)-like protein